MRNLVGQLAVIAGIGILGVVVAVAPGGVSIAAEKAVPLPVSPVDVVAKGPQVAVLAGGCFWGMEAVFEQLDGVKSVTSGYAGGTAETATYDQVTTETTGHAEAIRIVYDPAKISYATLLRVYFSVAHDPTQLNRQGPDRGPSYRSAIFPQTKAQADVAKRYIATLSNAKVFAKPIVTRIETGKFFAAEAYHQDFMARNPSHPYIVAWDRPKVAALKAGYPQLLKRG